MTTVSNFSHRIMNFGVQQLLMQCLCFVYLCFIRYLEWAAAEREQSAPLLDNEEEEAGPVPAVCRVWTKRQTGVYFRSSVAVHIIKGIVTTIWCHYCIKLYFSVFLGEFLHFDEVDLVGISALSSSFVHQVRDCLNPRYFAPSCGASITMQANNNALSQSNQMT